MHYIEPDRATDCKMLYFKTYNPDAICIDSKCASGDCAFVQARPSLRCSYLRS